MFKGHTDSITNLMINPKDDYFLTTSNDNTMRIWNLNSKNQGKSLANLECEFKLNVEAESMSAYPVANFDPTGVAFAVAWSEQQKDKQIVRICLYGIDGC
jgi:COMPASS component SWD2